eukprot:CAMPEP_0172311700 /NCGR_PEP_ID=MMETSP1058-20130122/15593_1 /TAXON_ID=83371 /ORGANISM="Detonula confervacea, Strain CCMP 353" /LENGTH=107 /DNA_ID=CAMNT_0013024973 /DNA_START=207 /DNA_END=530 /DNA_ORIENTATION=-
MSKSNSDKLIRLFQIFSAKLVLEVFGGAGAIWGFSEAVGLRVATNIWFWRPCALTVGTIFFARWIMQMQDCILEENIRLPFAVGKAANGDDEENISLHPQHEAKVYN